MPENSQTTNSAKTAPLLTPEELLSMATLLAASSVALMALVCRWFIEYQGQGLLLLLIAASATTGLILLRRNNQVKLAERACHYLLATLSIIALLSWSPDFAFSILVCLPVLIAATLPHWFRVLGYEYRMGAGATMPSNPIEGGIDEAWKVANTPMVNERPESLVPPSETVKETDSVPALDSSEENHEAEDDPWAFVQGQFVQDPTLSQNVAQWKQADGTRCIVANIRCLFNSVDETCIVQLPFWPILNQAPEVFCRVANGPAASVKTTQELPHGLRLEVRLDDRSPAAEANLQDDVIVEVVASVSSETNEIAA